MVQVAVSATDIVELDVRVRVGLNERDLDAGVHVDAWIQLCVQVWVAVHVFVGPVEC